MLCAPNQIGSLPIAWPLFFILFLLYFYPSSHRYHRADLKLLPSDFSVLVWSEHRADISLCALLPWELFELAELLSQQCIGLGQDTHSTFLSTASTSKVNRLTFFENTCLWAIWKVLMFALKFLKRNRPFVIHGVATRIQNWLILVVSKTQERKGGPLSLACY